MIKFVKVPDDKLQYMLKEFEAKYEVKNIIPTKFMTINFGFNYKVSEYMIVYDDGE